MIFFITVVLLLVDLLLTLLVKNLLNGLTWHTFINWYAGTLLHIFIISFIIVLLILLYLRKNERSKNFPRLIPATVIVGIALLISGYLIREYDFLSLNRVVYWDYKLSYVLSGVFFSLHYLLLLGVLSFLWLRLFRTETLFSVRLVANIFYCAVLLALFAFVYCLTANPIQNSGSKKWHTGVVLGSAVQKDNTPGTAHKRRLDRAVLLLNEGEISNIFLTGSNTPGRMSEAEAGFKYLLEKNISKEIIALENKTTSTVEQVRYLKEHLSVSVLPKQIVVISDAYHLPRISQVTEFYDLPVDLIATDSKLSLAQRIYLSSREAIALLIFWLYAI